MSISFIMSLIMTLLVFQCSQPHRQPRLHSRGFFRGAPRAEQHATSAAGVRAPLPTRGLLSLFSSVRQHARQTPSGASNGSNVAVGPPSDSIRGAAQLGTSPSPLRSLKIDAPLHTTARHCCRLRHCHCRRRAAARDRYHRTMTSAVPLRAHMLA